MPWRLGPRLVWYSSLQWDEEKGKYVNLPILAREWVYEKKVYVEPLIYEYYREIRKMKDELEEKSTPTEWVGTSDPFLKNCPEINRQVTDAWFESGKPRTPASLKITFGGDSAMVTLMDNERSRSMSTTAGTVAEALKLMEAHIRDRGPAWRVWNFDKGGKKK